MLHEHSQQSENGFLDERVLRGGVKEGAPSTENCGSESLGAKFCVDDLDAAWACEISRGRGGVLTGLAHRARHSYRLSQTWLVSRLRSCTPACHVTLLWVKLEQSVMCRVSTRISSSSSGRSSSTEGLDGGKIGKESLWFEARKHHKMYPGSSPGTGRYSSDVVGTSGNHYENTLL